MKSAATITAGLTIPATASAAAEERYIATSGGPNINRRLNGTDFELIYPIEDANVYILGGPADSADELRNIGGIQAATPDYSYELDLPSSPEPSSTEADQWDKELIEAFAAHEHSTGDGIQIGILDTGIDYDHPAFSENLNTDLSRNFIDGEIGDDGDEVHYHGTHVAGIAAGNDGDYYYGTAPDAELISLRIFPSEGDLLASVADTFMALDYAAENDFDVVNMSIGSAPQPPQDNSEANEEGGRVSRERVVQSVVQRGTNVVVAAGNDDTNLQQGGWYQLWGSLQNVISVGATDENDDRASFSNYGTPHIDVAAPGANIYGPVDSAELDTDYAYLSGTSMASPQVAGLAALAIDVSSNTNPRQIERDILHGAELANGRSDPELGAGRINALNTVQ